MPSRQEAYATKVQELLSLLKVVIIFLRFQDDEDRLISILGRLSKSNTENVSILRELKTALIHLNEGGGPHDGGGSLNENAAFRPELLYPCGSRNQRRGK